MSQTAIHTGSAPAGQQGQASTTIVVLAFLAIYFIWGSTYLAILFGLTGFPPFLLSALRFFSAGLILFIWRRCKGEPMPVWGSIRAGIISGCLILSFGTGLVTWGEVYVSSAQAAILMATEPFWFLLLDKKNWPVYFSSKWIVSGLIIGFTGVFLFFQLAPHTAAKAHGAMFIIANAVLIISAISWVSGSLYGKRSQVYGSSSFMVTAVQLMGAGVCSGLVSLAMGEWGRFSFNNVSLQAWGGLAYLSLFGSLVAYLAFTWLLTVRPPVIVSTHAYINPIVAVVLGWAFAQERLSTGQFIALFVILLGVLLTNIQGYKALRKAK